MARLAVHETPKNFPREVVRWLEKELISFTSKFGDYIHEDPSSFCLSTNFSLYPQFMYHLRRSLFIDVFNSSPDETAFFPVMLIVKRDLWVNYSSIQPDSPISTSFSDMSLTGPPNLDPNHECFRKLLEAPAIEAEQLVSQRIPVPKLVKCEQHIRQARFLLAKLNPSATHKSSYVDGSEVRMTDDVSLQVFLEHLQELAVQG
ncbi:protein transport protein Sec23 [Tanacetum coccineum]